jgi:hypothetical protein
VFRAAKRNYKPRATREKTETVARKSLPALCLDAGGLPDRRTLVREPPVRISTGCVNLTSKPLLW